jgi:hypothetical protein
MESRQKPLILVLGSGKAGTTALFYCVKASAEQHFGTPFPTLFEPKAASNIAAFRHEFGVVKMILDRFAVTEKDFIPRFAKRIFIVRDPRDNFISRLIWFVKTRLPEQNPKVRQETIELFARKQSDPDSIGVFEIFSFIEKKFDAEGVSTYSQKSSFLSCDFFSHSRDDFFALRYEDFVERQLGPLSEYLGFPLVHSFEIDRRHQAVFRTGGYGSWKNWFTEDDRISFVDPNRERLISLGYEDERPYAQKRIDPAEATEYFRIDQATPTPGERWWESIRLEWQD